MQPIATKIKRPSKFRGPTNYAIEGYKERFRYVQHHGHFNDPIMNWTSTDEPRRHNGRLLVVARVGANLKGFGLFEELGENETY